MSQRPAHGVLALVTDEYHTENRSPQARGARRVGDKRRPVRGKGLSHATRRTKARSGWPGIASPLELGRASTRRDGIRVNQTR